jgi:hypothetical protein
MDRAGFEKLVERLGEAWMGGDAVAAAACFCDDVEYSDPRLYRFASRAELEPFFEPGPDGHSVTWHRILCDEAKATGVLEYTYMGHHRYHGAAAVELAENGLIRRWRDWQHRDNEHDWEAYLAGAVHLDRQSP